jgi:hypothetical protein
MPGSPERLALSFGARGTLRTEEAVEPVIQPNLLLAPLLRALRHGHVIKSSQASLEGGALSAMRQVLHDLFAHRPGRGPFQDCGKGLSIGTGLSLGADLPAQLGSQLLQKVFLFATAHFS